MAQAHAIHDQQAVQELMVTELLAELQTIDEKARMVVRFCEVMDVTSQNEMQYRNESTAVSYPIKVRKGA